MYASSLSCTLTISPVKLVADLSQSIKELLKIVLLHSSVFTTIKFTLNYFIAPNCLYPITFIDKTLKTNALLIFLTVVIED